MKTSGFLLFRLNLVDRDVLFQKPISRDEDLIRVFQLAANPDFDVTRSGRRTTYRWALREVTADSIEPSDRSFMIAVFTSEIMSRRGPIVTPDGIAHGTSTMNPPPAVLVHIFVDLARHICAIEERHAGTCQLENHPSDDFEHSGLEAGVHLNAEAESCCSRGEHHRSAQIA